MSCQKEKIIMYGKKSVKSFISIFVAITMVFSLVGVVTTKKAEA